MTRYVYETDLTDNEWVSLNPIPQNTSRRGSCFAGESLETF